MATSSTLLESPHLFHGQLPRWLILFHSSVNPVLYSFGRYSACLVWLRLLRVLGLIVLDPVSTVSDPDRFLRYLESVLTVFHRKFRASPGEAYSELGCQLGS
mgnify:CR=1 FL=1